MLRSAILAAPVLAIAGAAAAAEPPRYSLTVAGGVNGMAPTGPVSLPLAINNNGRMVGYGYAGNNTIQALNWKDGIRMDLGGVNGFDFTYANQVNDRGRIAGAGYIFGGNGAIVQSRAVKWTGGQMSLLGTLGGQHSAALAINSADQIVGYSTLPGEHITRAFLFSEGVMTPISTLPGATESYAYDISDTGYIVGAAVAGAPARPYIWRGGYSAPLHIPAGARTGAANAVNNLGIAVGTYEINQYQGTFAAVLWVNGLRLELGNLGGGTAYAVARDINNRNQVVGTSNSPNGLTGFIWDNGVMYDLRDLVLDDGGPVEIVHAHSINDWGQIAAAAMIDGRQTAVVLTPITPNVPAPGPIAALGITGVFAFRRRR